LTPELSLGHWVAAIRELFEETGIFIGVDRTGAAIRMADENKRRLPESHRLLLETKVSFAELLEAEGWFCDASRVAYFAHWQTPEEFAMRFDTRFFLALLPERQTPSFRSREVADAVWISPDHALFLYQKGELPLIFPTYASLRMLADFASLSVLCATYHLR
jgi:8-oxo-dGTP pyrophosphatase MutT (NUDIX family)